VKRLGITHGMAAFTAGAVTVVFAVAMVVIFAAVR
jgi:hypothetical protein